MILEFYNQHRDDYLVRDVKEYRVKRTQVPHPEFEQCDVLVVDGELIGDAGVWTKVVVKNDNGEVMWQIDGPCFIA